MSVLLLYYLYWIIIDYERFVFEPTYFMENIYMVIPRHFTTDARVNDLNDCPQSLQRKHIGNAPQSIYIMSIDQALAKITTETPGIA